MLDGDRVMARLGMSRIDWRAQVEGNQVESDAAVVTADVGVACDVGDEADCGGGVSVSRRLLSM